MKKYFILILLFIPISIFGLDYPTYHSQIIEVYDLDDNKVLYEKEANKKVSIASLTKIATTITAIENINNLDEKVTITYAILKTVAKEASVAGLKAGDVVTYRDLLYASMLPSGADATHALAILSSGDIDSFVLKMNELSTKIGLENTHFVNVTGLDEKDHFSSADDVRKLLEYSLNNPLFREIYTSREYTMSNGKIVKSTIYKYGNNIDTSTIMGSKTGFTYDAGYCLSTLTEVNGHEMITILLNAPKIGNTYYNVNDTVDLILFLKEHYDNQVLIHKKDFIKSIPVKYGKIDSYDIHIDKDLSKYLVNDYDTSLFKYKYDGLDELSFLNYKGDKIGTLKYYYDDELLYEQSIVLKRDIKIDISKILKDYYLYIITFILIVFLLVFIIRKRKKAKR